MEIYQIVDLYTEFLNMTAVTIINLALIPFIAVYIYFGKETNSKHNRVTIWALASLLNYIIAKGICAVLSIFIGISYEIYSFPFAVLCFIISFITPYVLLFLAKRFSFSIEVNKDEK